MRNHEPQGEDLPEVVSRWVFRRWKWLAGLAVAVIVCVLLLALNKFLGTPTPTKPVDINTATREQLAHIPHIREPVADAIIQARPYSSVEDVTRAYGVGPKTLEWLRPYIFVATNSPA